MLKKVLHKSVKLDMRMEPALKKQIGMAAALEKKTITNWVEAAIKDRLKEVSNNLENVS